MKLISGGQIIYRKLVKNNVKDVWLYSGGAIMPLIDCFNNQKEINYYINTTEQNLGHSATGYARSLNKPGICIVTSGPGLTNMITPMLDAQYDHTPLIVFSGQVALNVMGTQAFQEAPSTEMTKVFTKWSYCVKNTEELNDVVDEAFKVCMEGKKGVVHIDLPKCILTNKINEREINKTIYNKKIYENINNNKLNEICDLINNSDKPLLCVGKGCNEGYMELKELVEQGNIPITTTIHGVGCYNENNKLSLKFMGMHGSYTANNAIQESDCIIALGTRFDDRIIGNKSNYAPKALEAYKKKKGGIIHCNIDKKIFNSIIKTQYNVHMDCKEFIKKLLKKIKYKKRKKWENQINLWRKENGFIYEPKDNIIYSQDVLIKLNKLIKIRNKDKYIFTTGVGNHQMFTAQFIDFTEPNSLITSGSMGVMGFGLPAAIGVSIGNPDKTVIDIDGDGSFLMTLNDLKTVYQYNLKNLKILILNNKTLGMVDIWEKLFYNNRITATDNSYCPDFYKVANSFGIKSMFCDNKKNLNSILYKFLAETGPILCEIKVKHTPCYPLVAPGKSLNEMILWNSTNIKIDKTLPPS
jgi:acetolactate synthase I/II/III large subunit